MVAPPAFADLGKSARDLFNKGYNHGFIKVESTTRSGANGDVEFKTNAAHNLTSQKLAGNVEFKYKIPQHGITLTEKWNTENVLGTVFEVRDQFARGLKVTVDSTYSPNTAKRSGIVKTEWANDLAKINADLSLSGGPVLNLAGVVARQDWLFGVQTKFDISSNELKNSSIAFGRLTPEYAIHTYTNDGRDFGASLYHRVHKNLELGTQLGWTVGEQNVRYGFASKYRVNNDLFVRAKIDNKSNVAVAATHALSPDLSLTFTTQFALVNAPEVTNKFGVGIEYTPK
jgi:hypothetical protein